VAAPLEFDVLVVGSGASGLAAAVSADRAGARVGLVAKDAVQSCNSAKAQGGIQAAFGDDDSPEQHAEDVWKSSHETADRRLVEALWQKVHVQMSAAGVTNSDWALFETKKVPKLSHARYCTIATSFVREVGRLAQNETAILMREILRPSTH